jgi:hypothetical protein
VRRSGDFHGGDGSAFQRGKEHAAEGVADGVTITTFKRLRRELAIGVGGRRLVFREAIRHFESG